MKKILGIFVCTLLILTSFFSVTGIMDVEQEDSAGLVYPVDCKPCVTHKMHFPQMPDEDGWAVSATYVAEYQSGVALADDWMCSESGPVANIRFWGSWKQGVEGIIDCFWISIHDDIPADESPTGYSMPGEILWWREILNWETIPIESSSYQGWYCVESETWDVNDHTNFFQYDIVDIQRPYRQEEGTIYWLSIQANVLYAEDYQPVWGWKSSEDHWNDDAVWCNVPDYNWIDLFEPPEHTVSLDLAYMIMAELTEGLLFDAFFQPVQVVFQDDPVYPPTDMNGECAEIVAELEMVAGKNTLLFGHPYEKRHEIKIQVCNNYKEQKTFQFVMKINPGDKEIWRSEWLTVEPGPPPTVFPYGTPFPPTGRFKWDTWPEDIKQKKGEIILYLEPDPGAKDPAPPCKCAIVRVNVTVVKTHDLKILWLPFTFEDGPDFPPDLIGRSGSEFDQWMWESLDPWWNGVYPLRESGLSPVRSLTPIKTNITLYDGTEVSDLATFGALNRAQVLELWGKLVRASIDSAWLWSIKHQGYDRVVWLVSPDIMRCPADATNRAIVANGLAHRLVKFGVLVNWSTRSKTAAHEISHTYGLDESYLAGQQNRTVGYWVNRGWFFGSEADVLNSSLNHDLMYITWPIWEEPGQKTWIKKPNYKALLKKFNEEEDPEVLGISGCIDKNDDVRLHPWYKLDEGNIDLEWGTTGSYLVKTYDSNEKLLNEAGFDISFTMYVTPGEEIPIDETIFAFRVEWIDGMHRVDIVNVNSNQVLATRTITPNTPQISITSPQPGETIKPEPCEITWDATDLDGDTLTYHIFLSNDSGASWFPMSLALHENSFTADFTHLLKGNYQITVSATDGWNVDEDIVDFAIKKGKDKSTLPDLLFLRQLWGRFPLLVRLLSIFTRFTVL